MASMTSDVTRHLNFASKFFKACGQAGFSPTELNMLAQDVPLLKQARNLLHQKMSEAEVDKHTINTAAAPVIPGGCSIVENHVYAKPAEWPWDPSKIHLFVHEEQKKERFHGMPGEKLRKELVRTSVLNAVVLDYLLEHQHLVPASWQSSGREGRRIYFFGTVYRNNSDQDMDSLYFVRGLWWDHNHWRECHKSFGQEFQADEPAAVYRNL